MCQEVEVVKSHPAASQNVLSTYIVCHDVVILYNTQAQNRIYEKNTDSLVKGVIHLTETTVHSDAQ